MTKFSNLIGYQLSLFQTELDSTQSYYHYLLSFKPLLFSSLSFLFDQFVFLADYSVRNLPRGDLTSETFFFCLLFHLPFTEKIELSPEKEEDKKSKISQYILTTDAAEMGNTPQLNYILLSLLPISLSPAYFAEDKTATA